MATNIALIRKQSDRDFLPEPSSPGGHHDRPHHRDGVACLIDVPTKASRVTRINITLPPDLVAAIGCAAHSQSRFLAEAARAKLHAA